MPKVNLKYLEDLKDRDYPKIQKIKRKKPKKDKTVYVKHKHKGE